MQESLPRQLSLFRQDTLFRPEAIEYQRHHRRWGKVALLQPVSTKFLSWSLVAAIAAIAVFLCLAPYARKQTVIGYLTPAAGTAKILASQDGVIQQVYVRQGQDVRKGQPLLTIGTQQMSADGKSVQDEILSVLTGQKTMLQQQIAAEQTRESAERNRLRTLLRGHATEMTILQEKIATQHDRIKLAESLVTSATELHDKGYLSNLEYTRRLSGILEEKQSLSTLNQQVLKLRGEIAEAESSLDQLPATMGEKIQSLRTELSATEQRISETNGRRAYTVQSPVDGYVALLAAAPGQTADPRRVQMEIVPRGSALRAQLFVPARAIGFIEPGEKVRVLYDAFPYQEFGTYGGVVTEVSHTMQNAADASGPIRLEQPAYRVIATLDATGIDAHGKRFPLQPDMTLKAEIILEKRPLIRWLLEPLLGTRL
jgi:membrane fusion protein